MQSYFRAREMKEKKRRMRRKQNSTLNRTIASKSYAEQMPSVERKKEGNKKNL
jgi:hypothetical protein